MTAITIADLAVRLSANAGPIAQAAAAAAKGIAEIEKQARASTSALGALEKVAAGATSGVAKFGVEHARSMVSARVRTEEAARATKAMAAEQARMAQEAGRAAQALNKAYDLGRLVVGGAIVKRLAGEFQHLAKDVFGAGARIEELDTVMGSLAATNKLSLATLREQAQDVRKLGIVYQDAQDSVTQFVKSGLDVRQTAKLARVAQDSAVLAGTDSTSAFQRLIYGIQTRQLEVIRTAGLNVSFESAYAKYAATMKKSVNQLTEAEKAQIALNAVLDAGKSVAGTYEAAMSVANKQLRSTPRYLKEIGNELSQGLTPLFAAQVESINNWLKVIEKATVSSGIQGRLRVVSDELGDGLRSASEGALGKVEKWLEGDGVERLRSKFSRAMREAQQTGLAGATAAAFAVPQALSRIPGLDAIVGGTTRNSAALATLVAGNQDLRRAAADIARTLGEVAAAAAKPLADALETLNTFLSKNAKVIGELATQASSVVASYATVANAAASLATGPLQMLANAAAMLTSALEAVHGGAIAAHGGMALFLALQMRSFIGDIVGLYTKLMLLHKGMQLFRSSEVQNVIKLVSGGLGALAQGEGKQAAGIFAQLGAPAAAPVQLPDAGNRSRLSRLRTAARGARLGVSAFGGASPAQLAAIGFGEAQRRGAVGQTLADTKDLAKGATDRLANSVRKVKQTEDELAAASERAGSTAAAAHTKAAVAAEAQAAAAGRAVNGVKGAASRSKATVGAASAAGAAADVAGAIAGAAPAAAAAGAAVGDKAGQSMLRRFLARATDTKIAQAGAEVANQAFAGFNSYSAALGKVGVISIAATVGITALTARMSALQAQTQKARDKLSEFYDEAFKRDAPRASADLVKDLQGRVADLDAAATKARDRSKRSIRDSIVVGIGLDGRGALPGAGKLRDVLGLTNAEDDARKRLNNLKAVIRDFADDAGARAAELRDKWVAELKEVGNAAEIAYAKIKASAKSGADAAFIELLSPAQVQQYEGLLSELVQSTKSWSTQFPSIFAAWAERENQNFDYLEAFYRQKMQQLQNFDTGIRALQDAGLNQADLQELIKAGPGQAGQIISAILAQGTEGLQQYVAMANKARETTDGLVKSMQESVAQRDFLNQLQSGTAAIGESQSSAIDDLGKRMQQLRETAESEQEAFGKLAALAESQLKANTNAASPNRISTVGDKVRGFEVQTPDLQPAIDVVHNYQKAWETAFQAISSGQLSAEQAQGAILSVVQAGEKAVNVTGDAGRKVVDEQVATLREIAKLIPHLVDLQRVAGKDAAIQLAAGIADGRPEVIAEAVRTAIEASEAQIAILRAAREQLSAELENNAGGLAAQVIGRARIGAVDAQLSQITGQTSKAQQLLTTLQDKVAANAKTKTAQDEFIAAHAADMAETLYPNMDEAKKRADEQEALADRIKAAQIEPLDLFRRAAGETIDLYVQLAQASDNYADSVEGLANQIVGFARAGDNSAKAQRAIRQAVLGMVSGIKSQVEAMAQLGQISKDVNTMTSVFKQKVDDLRSSLPSLVEQLIAAGDATKTLEERVADAAGQVDKAIGGYLNEQDAVDGRIDAYRKLKQAIMDQRALLTGVLLSDEDRADIVRDGNKALREYVKAVKAEAVELARSGKIGSSYEDQQAYIQKRLAEVGVEFDELKRPVDEYNKRLAAVPKDVKSKVQLLIDEAMAAVQSITQSISNIPSKAVSIQVDANTQAAEQALDRVSSKFDSIIGKQQQSKALADRSAAFSAALAQWEASGSSLTARLKQAESMIEEAAEKRSQSGIQYWYAIIQGLRGEIDQHAAQRPNAAYYDTGGTLDPGMHYIKNATGGREFILTPDQFNGLIDALHAATTGGTKIENLNVTTDQPPREWLDEALYRTVGRS